MIPELSIVIPVHNESPNIKPLYDELTQTLGQYGRSYEMLIIDDGSTDDTFEQLAALQARDPRLRVIRFRRNFGQTAAFAAGIAHARGRLVVTSDGDLQNDPRDIPAMVALIEQGNDIVCGWRKDRKDTFVTRRLPSVLANKLISWATGVRAARLRLLAEGVSRRGREAAAALRRDASLPAGDRQPDRRQDRRDGRQSSAAPRRRHEVRTVAHHSRGPRSGDGEVPVELLDAAAADLRPDRPDHRRPRRADHRATSATSACSRTQGIGDRPLLLLGVMLVFIGVQLVTFGLLAEVMARTYYESQDKPTYVIREVRETDADG